MVTQRVSPPPHAQNSCCKFPRFAHFDCSSYCLPLDHHSRILSSQHQTSRHNRCCNSDGLPPTHSNTTYSALRGLRRLLALLFSFLSLVSCPGIFIRRQASCRHGLYLLSNNVVTHCIASCSCAHCIQQSWCWCWSSRAHVVQVMPEK